MLVGVCVCAPRRRERRAYGRGSRGSALSASATLERQPSRVREAAVRVGRTLVLVVIVCACVLRVDGARVLRALTR